MSKLNARMEQIEVGPKANRNTTFLCHKKHSLMLHCVSSSIYVIVTRGRKWCTICLHNIEFSDHDELHDAEWRYVYISIKSPITFIVNIDLATNELILSDAPNEAILVKINNKIPGLGLQLDAPELNLLYKDKYNAEVPDSYEQLLDFIDGDNHLIMRSDELAAAWNILTPTLQEIDKKRTTPELYELGGRGPIGPYYLYAKYQVRWVGRQLKLVEGFESDV
uniref:Glucose-6-phosphate dehydrogenase C-terminal domain-containing protein n=1 Tax=Populus davidiana TaxID=266767 RepID=A0A6M2F558_9ROSI